MEHKASSTRTNIINNVDFLQELIVRAGCWSHGQELVFISPSRDSFLYLTRVMLVDINQRLTAKTNTVGFGFVCFFYLLGALSFVKINFRRLHFESQNSGLLNEIRPNYPMLPVGFNPVSVF